MGGHSDRVSAGSGSCAGHVLAVGLETGVSWTGGEGHGEPRGDTLGGGKPEKRQQNVSNGLLLCHFPRVFQPATDLLLANSARARHGNHETAPNL